MFARACGIINLCRDNGIVSVAIDDSENVSPASSGFEDRNCAGSCFIPEYGDDTLS